MIISGKDIILRSISEDDTEEIVRWRNTDFVKECFIYRKPFTKEIHENWLKTMVKTDKVKQFIIFEKSSERKIGSVYLRDIDYDNSKCEYGIFIGEKDCLSKGYGKEAAKLITDFAFKILQLNKVFLRVLADNERAKKSYEKTGFRVEGVFKADVWIDGVPRDVIFMAKFKEQ